MPDKSLELRQLQIEQSRQSQTTASFHSHALEQSCLRCVMPLRQVNQKFLPLVHQHFRKYILDFDAYVYQRS